MTTERGYPWLKLWTAYGEDPRFLRLSDAARARFWDLYILAGKADAGGLILAGDNIATLEDLAFILRRETDQVKAAVEELVNASLLTSEAGGWEIARFTEEQGPAQSEKRQKWKERQARKREKFGVEELNKNSDSEEDQDQDQSKSKSKSKRSRESHARVTRDTHTATPAAGGMTEAEADEVWIEETGWIVDSKRMEKIRTTLQSWGETDPYYGFSARDRLRAVVHLWDYECEEARKRGAQWGRVNPEAILERFPLPGLEKAVEALGITFGTEEAETIRKRVLIDFREVHQ